MADHAVSIPSSVEIAGRNSASAGLHLAAERAGSRRSPRLLVVDDDAAIRELAIALLGAEGYDVVTAEDGLDALRQIEASAPDLVISDLRMPHMTGFELLRIMRARFPEIPVIAVSGEVDGETSLPGVIADAVFAKGSFTTPRFRAVIAGLLAIPPRRDEADGRKKNRAEKSDSASAAVVEVAVEEIAAEDTATENVVASKGFHGVADMRAVLGRLAERVRPAAALSLSPASGIDHGTDGTDGADGADGASGAAGSEPRSAFGTSFD
ncbi:MAG: response regulator [Acidobacteriota bacterium]|nr:response regulator [Acidobacteriota bacterium]